MFQRRSAAAYSLLVAAAEAQDADTHTQLPSSSPPTTHVRQRRRFAEPGATPHWPLRSAAAAGEGAAGEPAATAAASTTGAAAAPDSKPAAARTAGEAARHRVVVRIVLGLVLSVLLLAAVVVLTALYPHAPRGRLHRSAALYVHWFRGVPYVEVALGTPPQLYKLALVFTSVFTNITLFESAAGYHYAYSATYDAVAESDVLRLPYPSGMVRVPVRVLAPTYTVPESILMTQSGFDGVLPLGPDSFVWSVPLWRDVLVTYERLHLYEDAVRSDGADLPFVPATLGGGCTLLATASTNVSASDADEHVWHAAAHVVDGSLPHVTHAVLFDQHTHHSRVCLADFVPWVAGTRFNHSASRVRLDSLEDGGGRVYARLPMREPRDYDTHAAMRYKLPAGPSGTLLLGPDETTPCTHVHLGYAALRQNALLLRGVLVGGRWSAQEVCIHPHRDLAWTHLGFLDTVGVAVLALAVFTAIAIMVTEFHVGQPLDMHARPWSFMLQTFPVLYAVARIVYHEGRSSVLRPDSDDAQEGGTVAGTPDAHNAWLGAAPAYRGGAVMVNMTALCMCLLIGTVAYGGWHTYGARHLSRKQRRSAVRHVSGSALVLMAIWAVLTSSFISLALVYLSRVVLFAYEEPVLMVFAMVYLVVCGVLAWASLLEQGTSAWQWPLWGVLRPASHLAVWIGYVLPYQAHRFRVGTSLALQVIFASILALVVEYTSVVLATRLLRERGRLLELRAADDGGGTEEEEEEEAGAAVGEAASDASED